MSASDFGASPKKRAPHFIISAIAFSWYGTEAITKSGRSCEICSDFAVQESATMATLALASSGHTSRQYFVQPTTAPSLPRSRRITLALDYNETTRTGEKVIPLSDRVSHSGET